MNDILKDFYYSHLTGDEREVCKAYYDLAYHLDKLLPDGDEKIDIINKLVLSKEAAVRLSIDPDELKFEQFSDSQFFVRDKHRFLLAEICKVNGNWSLYSHHKYISIDNLGVIFDFMKNLD